MELDERCNPLLPLFHSIDLLLSLLYYYLLGILLSVAGCRVCLGVRGFAIRGTCTSADRLGFYLSQTGSSRSPWPGL